VKKFAAGAALALVAAFLVLLVVHRLPRAAHTKTAARLQLAEPDVPPLEFAYLDTERVDAYLGQAEDGLAEKEQRGEQIKRAVNAGLNVGANATIGASEQDEESASSTVAANAADRFYAFLRLLRKEPQASVKKSKCNEISRTDWLGELDLKEETQQAMQEVECIGVGNFIRIDDVQLFLPPFAQALPRVQSTNAFYGALPAPRSPFTSPAQSVALRHALHDYAKRVGTSARMPFVGAPYGEHKEVGGKVALFMPTEYRGLTHEPSLLTGSVTVVGKIIYIARPPSKSGRKPKLAAPAYIDYPTIDTFGRALLHASPVFRADLGVCSKHPTLQTRAQAPTIAQSSTPRTHRSEAAPGSGALTRRQVVERRRAEKSRARGAKRRCTPRQKMLDEVKKAVSFKAPLVIVLPLAIYD
jgi:hypothetical protein